MSSPQASPRLYRIDIVDHVGRAYRAVFDRLQLVVEMALLPYLLMLAVDVAVLLIIPGGTAAGIIGALIHTLALLLFGSVFFVRWQRFLLLGETVGGELLPPGWREFVIASVQLGALVFAGWVVLVLVALLPPFFITIPLTAAGGVALTLFALRLSLIFPAAATGQPVALRIAWDWIAGNFWRLFACAFSAYFPFAVLQMLIGAIGAAAPSLTGIIVLALQLAASFLGSAVVGALLAQLYQDIGAAPAEAGATL